MFLNTSFIITFEKINMKKGKYLQAMNINLKCFGPRRFGDIMGFFK